MYDPAVKLESLVVRAQQLCSLPTVAMKVLELTSNPQVDTRALKDCIENDPALTGKILRVVNSSLFGLSREVSSLNQALALLGNKPLKLLVLGFSLPPELFEGLSGDSVGQYWRRTLTKAVAARELSETVWKLPGDEAFIAALLQDVGELLLIQEFGEPYVSFLRRVYESDADLTKTEVRTMGFSHIELSARLLAQWGLPETLVEAVGWDPESRDPASMSNAGRTLAQVVHLAELVARLMLDGRPGVLGELMDVGNRYHGLTESHLEEVVSQLEKKVRQLADVLSLQLPDGMDYRDVLMRSQMQMAEGSCGDGRRNGSSSRDACRRRRRRHGRQRDTGAVEGGHRVDGRPTGGPFRPSAGRELLGDSRGERGRSTHGDGRPRRGLPGVGRSDFKRHSAGLRGGCGRRLPSISLCVEPAVGGDPRFRPPGASTRCRGGRTPAVVGGSFLRTAGTSGSDLRAL